MARGLHSSGVMIQKAPHLLLTALLCLASIHGAAKGIVKFDDPNPGASGDICQMTAEDFLAKAAHPGNLTANANASGPLNTGLCWWHSKMQRAAIYLAVFDRPAQPRPTQAEAIQIFKQLRDYKAVVSIPGFIDWNEFTEAFRLEFYQVLGHWEIQESLRLGFVQGLRAEVPTSTQMLQKISDEVNDYKRVTFLLLKMRYLEAHSWLVQSMDLKGSDFKMDFIDSNWSNHVTVYESHENTYRYSKHNGLHKEVDVATGFRKYRYAWQPDEDVSSYPREKGLIYPKTSGPAPMSLYLQNDNLFFQKVVSAIKAKCGGETPFTLHEKDVVKRKIQKEFERQNWYRPGVPHN